MNARTTLIVTIVAVVGVLAAVWLERGGHPQSAGAATPLFETALGAFDQVAVRRRGEPTLVFARTSADDWTQIEPFEFPVDPFSMRQLVELVDGLAGTRIDVDPATVGLADAEPAAEVTLRNAAGERRVRLGRQGLAGRAYIQRDDDPAVYVVEQALHTRVLGMDPKEWRLRTLFPTATLEPSNIAMESGTSQIRLEREGRAWRMAAPVATRANQTAVDQLVQALTRARSQGFIRDEPESLGRFGLERPSGTIAVTTDGVTTTLRVGARVGVGTEDRFGLVEGRPVVVRVPAAVIQAFFPAIGTLVAQTASGVTPADVKRIDIAAGDTTFRLVRELDGWLDGEGRPVTAERVNAMLQTLTAVPATEIVFGTFPREDDVGRVTFYGYDGRPLDTVRCARSTADDPWIFDNGDGVLRRFPASTPIGLARAAYGDG